MSEIKKAIETEYNGHKFRSRLEARWAVFFDAVGIKYQYEPDGFEYDGDKYLPDFYLPDFEMYVEVKPDDPNRYGEIERAAKVCCLATGKFLLLLGENPNITDCGWWMYNAFYYHPANDRVMWRPTILKIVEAEEGFEPGFVTDYKILADPEIPLYGFIRSLDKKSHFPLSGMSVSDYEIPLSRAFAEEMYSPIGLPAVYDYKVSDMEDERCFEFAKKAYKKARQARFEHGETPKVEEQ